MSEAQRLVGRAGQEPAWDELPLDPPPAHATRRARPAWATVVAAILALNGISLVLYAGYIPAIAIWAPDPFPVIGAITGLLAFAAAFGVFRQLTWGRWLGIALAIGWLARDAVELASWLQTGSGGMGPTATNLLLDFALPIAVYVVVVELLVRRWPTEV
jgi:hypothetical protein